MTEWFVSSSGASGNAGTIGSPWDLTSALTGHSGAIKPDDTVWLRGGDYDFTDPNLSCTLAGLIGSGVDDIGGKIVVRVYNPTVVGTDRRQWFYNGKATDICTGDPSQTERMHLRATQSTAAPTSGALTVNGAHTVNTTTISIAKAAGVDQAVLAGHQFTIGTDRYLITAPVTIVAGTNTTVSVASPNAAQSNGAAVTVILNHSNIDTVQFSGAKFVWFWDWEHGQILKARTSPGYAGACWSLFNAVTDGLKFINNLIHDYAGSNHFVEAETGDIEGYGNITTRSGANGSTNDGGGHDYYLHHNALWTPSFTYVLGAIIEDPNGFVHQVTTIGTSGATQPTWNTVLGGTTSDNTVTWTNIRQGSAQARYQANCMISSYSLQMQCYDSDPNPVTHTLWKQNISINAGQLCSDVNIGGKDADAYVMGGGTTGTIRKLLLHDNFAFIVAALGSRAFNVAEGGGISGDGNEILRNRSYISGMGFGAIFVGAFAAGGQLTHRDNVYYVPAPQAGVGNGKCAEIQTNGGAQFDWGNNTWYRPLGNSQDFGSEVGSPRAFHDLAGAGQTLAQWLTDTGFVGDKLILAMPAQTETFVVRADKYQAGRGYALYFNHAGLTTIPINLSGLLQPGDKFVVHDVRDTLAGMRGQGGTPVIGTAAAPATLPPDGIVNFPNTQVSDPVPSGALQGVGNEVAAPATAPTFNCFLIQRIAAHTVTHEAETRGLAAPMADGWGE